MTRPTVVKIEDYDGELLARCPFCDTLTDDDQYRACNHLNKIEWKKEIAVFSKD